MYLPTRLPTDETETRADPFSLDALIAWLRTKNPDVEYCFINAGHCLLAQFLRATDARFVTFRTGTIWVDDFHQRHLVPSEIMCIASTLPHTFGAALSRATAIRGV